MFSKSDSDDSENNTLWVIADSPNRHKSKNIIINMHTADKFKLLTILDKMRTCITLISNFYFRY